MGLQPPTTLISEGLISTRCPGWVLSTTSPRTTTEEPRLTSLALHGTTTQATAINPLWTRLVYLRSLLLIKMVLSLEKMTFRKFAPPPPSPDFVHTVGTVGEA